MKYSFILEIDDISKDDMNELISVLANNHIKFHMLKSYKELKENKKYKEVINKIKDKLFNANYRNYDDDEDDTKYTDLDIDELLDILKEVEHD